jgi:hypothetical protein
MGDLSAGTPRASITGKIVDGIDLARFAHAAQPMKAQRSQLRSKRRRRAEEGIWDEELAVQLPAKAFEARDLVHQGADDGEVEAIGGADVAVGR